MCIITLTSLAALTFKPFTETESVYMCEIHSCGDLVPRMQAVLSQRDYAHVLQHYVLVINTEFIYNSTTMHVCVLLYDII